MVKAIDRALLDYLYSTNPDLKNIAIKHGVSKEDLEDEISKTKKVSILNITGGCSCCGGNQNDHHSKY